MLLSRQVSRVQPQLRLRKRRVMEARELSSRGWDKEFFECSLRTPTAAVAP